MKSIITLTIDEKEVKTEEGTSILDAAEQVGIQIPNLCHQQGAEPYGACRICCVEIEKGGRSRIVAACSYPVEKGLMVTTRSQKIDKIRKTILELAAASAGEDSGKLRALAHEYNADLSRFRSWIQIEPTKCILCGLCIRRCVEANWESAIGFIGRGVHRQVVMLPEKMANCSNCNYCYTVCPTGRITSTHVNPPFPHVDDVLAGRK